MALDSDVQARAAARQRERAATVERVLEATESLLGDGKFPTRREEVAGVYGDGPADLVNETESPGDAFDRLREQFGSVRRAREALSEDSPDRRRDVGTLSGSARGDGTP